VKLTIRNFLVICVAASAFLPSFTGTSLAEQFESSTTGTLSVEALTTQKVAVNAGSVECKKLSASSGEAPSATIIATVTIKPEECTAFGFLAATVSPAEYKFVLGGYVALGNTVTVELTGCTVTIPAQVMTGVSFKNVTHGGKAAIEVTPDMKDIESSGTGSLCAYATEGSGTYSGSFVLSLPGGGLELQAPAAPEFSVTANRNPVHKKAGEAESTITVTNLVNAANAPAKCTLPAIKPADWNEAEVNKCVEAYGAKEAHTFKVTYVGAKRAIYPIVVLDKKGAVASLVVLGE
jgi:hypothetical protein